MTGWLWLLAVIGGGCSESPVLLPVPALPGATDMNPDPNIVEVTLVATHATTEYVAGSATEVLAYRDGAASGSEATVPGPLIEARKGDRLIVHFRNELGDAGELDAAEAHFRDAANDRVPKVRDSATRGLSSVARKREQR